MYLERECKFKPCFQYLEGEGKYSLGNKPLSQKVLLEGRRMGRGREGEEEKGRDARGGDRDRGTDRGFPRESSRTRPCPSLQRPGKLLESADAQSAPLQL